VFLIPGNSFIFNFNMSKKYSDLFIVFIFSVGLIMLLVLISYFLDFGVRNANNDQVGKVNMIINHTIDPGVIAFGSSVGEVGLSSNMLSRDLGESVYNLCIDGTPYMQYRGLIDEFNSYSIKNRKVLFLEGYFSLAKPAGISSIERYLVNIGNENIYKSLFSIQSDLTWKCRYIPFYKYISVTHVYYKNSIYGWKNWLQHQILPDTLNGYRPIYRSWESDQDYVIKNTKPFKISIDSEVVKQYIKSIKNLQRNGKEVTIILTPIFYEVSKHLTDFSIIRQTFANISKLTGARFLDFTKSNICQERKYFYNSNHLNSKGSEIFTRQLADSLNEH
jgi:hypothetical protein